MSTLRSAFRQLAPYYNKGINGSADILGDLDSENTSGLLRTCTILPKSSHLASSTSNYSELTNSLCTEPINHRILADFRSFVVSFMKSTTEKEFVDEFEQQLRNFPVPSINSIVIGSPFSKLPIPPSVMCEKHTIYLFEEYALGGWNRADHVDCSIV